MLDPVLRGKLLQQPPAPRESFSNLALLPGKCWILSCDGSCCTSPKGKLPSQDRIQHLLGSRARLEKPSLGRVQQHKLLIFPLLASPHLLLDFSFRSNLLAKFEKFVHVKKILLGAGKSFILEWPGKDSRQKNILQYFENSLSPKFWNKPNLTNLYLKNSEILNILQVLNNFCWGLKKCASWNGLEKIWGKSPKFWTSPNLKSFHL